MSDVAILTTTRYRLTGELRFDLACRMVGSAVGNGHEVLIVDDSHDLRVREGFTRLGAQLYPAGRVGMAPGRRQLFTLTQQSFVEAPRAAKPDFFLWTEPEKDDLIRLIPQIVAPLRAEEADIVVVGRTEASWRTCPVLQSESERRANAIYREATGLDLDVFRGPVAFNRRSLPFFAACDPMKYGATTGYIQHIAPLEAHANGLTVAGVNVDFFYPLAQRAEEEGPLLEAMKEKWRQQFEECTDAYRKAAKALGLPKK